MPSAAFTVNSVANPAAHSAAYASTVNLALTSLTGAFSISWEIAGSSVSGESDPAITLAGSPVGSTASFPMPADPGDGLGRTYLVKCTVSDGRTTATEFGVVGAPNRLGGIAVAAGEENHRNATHGWTEAVNDAAAGIIASQDYVLWSTAYPVISSNMTYYHATGGEYWYQSNIGAAANFRIHLPRVNGVLKSVQIYMDGNRCGAGHAGFPGTMPQFILESINPVTPGAVTSLQSVTAVANANFGDGPTNFANTIANYDATWSVLLSNAGSGHGDMSHEANKIPTLLIAGETGANSVTGLTIVGIKTTWTATALRPGG